MRKSKGFTLLELVISISILATALIVIISTHASSMRMAAGVCREMSAFELAKEKLAEAELKGALSPGREEGQGDSGLRWERITGPMVVLDEAVPNMISVKVTVSDEGRRIAELATYILDRRGKRH